jgi:hypothetical protein
VTLSSALPRSYLTGTDWTYWFGPAAAPLLVLGDTDATGCQWLVDEPEGWAAPDAVTPIDARAYGDGGYAGDTTYTARTLSFGSTATGVCAAPDRAAAYAAMQRLRTVTQSRDPVLYTQSGYPPLSLWLRASGQPKMRWLDDRVFEFAFVMVAEDPLKFDAAQQAQPVTVGLPLSSGGYTYPLIYPKRYGTGSSTSGSVTVTNAGDESAQATYTLTGPLVTPTVLNATTGAYLTLAVTLGPLDVAVVDTRTGTVTVNGVLRYDLLAGGFPLIIPGANRIQWSHQDVYNDTARLSVATTSAWK